MLKDIKTYRKALDKVLMGAPDDLLAFMRQHGVPEPSSRASLEATFHKVTTASRTMPMERRRASKAWLTARGMHALDDGDV